MSSFIARDRDRFWPMFVVSDAAGHSQLNDAAAGGGLCHFGWLAHPRRLENMAPSPNPPGRNLTGAIHET